MSASDNANRRQPRDRLKVDINDPGDIAYWTNKWGCTEHELRHAAEAVGPLVHAIEGLLKAKHWKRR